MHVPGTCRDPEDTVRSMCTCDHAHASCVRICVYACACVCVFLSLSFTFPLSFSFSQSVSLSLSSPLVISPFSLVFSLLFFLSVSLCLCVSVSLRLCVCVLMYDVIHQILWTKLTKRPVVLHQQKFTHCARVATACSVKWKSLLYTR